MAVFYVTTTNRGATKFDVAECVHLAKLAANGVGYHFGEMSRREADKLVAVATNFDGSKALTVAARVMEATGKVPLRMMTYRGRVTNVYDSLLAQIKRNGEISTRVAYLRRDREEVRKVIARLMEEGKVTCYTRQNKVRPSLEITFIKMVEQ